MYIQAVIESYATWLEVKHPIHHGQFLKRLTAEPEAATAEAVAFNILRIERANPAPFEDVGTGGVDFQCRPSGAREFVAEVTAFAV